MKINKRLLYFSFAALLILISCAVVIHLIMAQSDAASIAADEICSSLNESGISCDSVEIQNQLLEVSFTSEGTDGCTVEDVKAIQEIYSLVHAQDAAQYVNDVHIIIYSPTGEILYDYTEKDVASSIENAEQLLSPDAAAVSSDAALTETNILAEAQEFAEGLSFQVESAELAEANEIDGQKLVMTLTGSSSFEPVSLLYDQLESYALETDAISQCEITVNDASGACLYYMTGDFVYGNLSSWVSPQAEETFLEEEAPPDRETQ